MENEEMLDMGYNKKFNPGNFDDMNIHEVTFEFLCPDAKEVKRKTINMTDFIESAYDEQQESADYYKGAGFYEHDTGDTGTDELLRDLRDELGDTDFQEALQKYLSKKAPANSEENGETNNSPKKVETEGGE